MSRTLEAITNTARGAVLAVAGLAFAYGCGAGLQPVFHQRDVNADGTRDWIHEHFGWNGRGQRTYEFSMRRGDNSDNHGTAYDPSRFRQLVHGRVILPSSPDSDVYFQDVDGDNRDDALVVERDASGRIDLYVRQFSRGGDPLHLVVRPPTRLVEDRQITDGASPVRY